MQQLNKNFKLHDHCNTKNIKYYKKGTVRSVSNYKLQQDLARGNILCEDCNNRGNLCGTIDESNLIQVHMHNNQYSEFYGGGTLVADISSVLKQGQSDFPLYKQILVVYGEAQLQIYLNLGDRSKVARITGYWILP